MFLPDYSHNIRSGDSLYVRTPEGLKLGVVHKRGGDLYKAYATSGTPVNNGHLYTNEMDAVHGVWDHDKRAQALLDCVFCQIGKGLSPAKIFREWDDAIAFYPRGGGCTEGHVMVCPREHVADAGEKPQVTAMVMFHAAQILGEMSAGNIATSKGTLSSQTIFHLHAHVFPRRFQDRLMMPWSESLCGCT